MSREAARESIATVDRIADWLRKNPKWVKDTILVGGWAVHSWAPYYFSVDIDLVIRKDARDALKTRLTQWGFYPVSPEAGEDKSKWQKDISGPQPVILDLVGVGKRMENSFVRDETRKIAWAQAIGHSSMRSIPWNDPPIAPTMRVCNVDLLLLYKIKALDDRTVRGAREPDHSGYLAEKRAKDAKDIWALLEVLRGNPELDLIRRYCGEYPFLKDVLRSASQVDGVLDPPIQGKIQNLRDLVEITLSLL